MLKAVPHSHVPSQCAYTPHNPAPVTTQITAIVKGTFCALTTPGFFASPEFFRGAEVLLGTVSCASALGTVIYVFAGRMDNAALSGLLVVTSAASAHLAGQVAVSKSIQEKLEKMENLNSQQAAQITHYQTLFKEFKKEIEDFKEFNVHNQEELAKVIQKFQEKVQASGRLIENIFKEGEGIQDFLKAIKEIKDPESILRRLNELDAVTKQLQNSQKELANTEGRLEMVIEDLRKMEEAHALILSEHRRVLAAHADETQKLQNALKSLRIA